MSASTFKLNDIVCMIWAMSAVHFKDCFAYLEGLGLSSFSFFRSQALNVDLTFNLLTILACIYMASTCAYNIHYI